MRHLVAILVAPVVTFLMTMSSFANDIATCQQDTPTDRARLQRMYSACSRLIAAGRATPESKSQYYFSRGNAARLLNRLHGQLTDNAHLDDYDRAIAIDPQNARAYMARSVDPRGKDQAFRDLATYIRLRPQDPDGYESRVMLLKEYEGDPEAAEADAREAARLGNGLAFVSVAEMWERRGRTDRAVAAYTRAVDSDPSNFYAYGVRGAFFEKLGELDKALADYRMALSLPLRDRESGNIKSFQDNISRVEKKLAAVAAKPAVQMASRAEEHVRADSVAAVAQPESPAKQSANAVEPQRESRMALVIGNSAYANAARLPNPKNDAELISATLRRTGFSRVDVHHDLGRERLLDTLKAFAAQADKADWAIVYFAGHGMEIGGVNYLVPVDANLRSDRDIPYEAVSVDQVLHAVGGTRKLKLVVLDACRDNPFLKTMTRSVATRAVGRGLAQMEPDSATLVAFAAKHGQVAQDGEGANSPFAAALAKAIETPGLEISLLLRKVRDDVLNATGRRQEPFTYGSLPSEAFYFRTP